MAYTRQYTQDVGWENEPSINTPLNATNLNKMDDAIGAVDLAAYNEFAAVNTALAGKQNTLTWDSTPTDGSSNPVTSDGIYDALAGKQATLTFDSAPTDGSSNPVTSDGIYDALAGKQNTLSWDSTPTQDSTKPVTSGGVYTALGEKMSKGVDYVTAGQLSGSTLGTKATAEGEGTTASKNASHAEGSYTTASENFAHAEGSRTTASGGSSHAEGFYSTASGGAAHAEGSHATASHDYSHAEGSYTITGATNQHVGGKYNVGRSDTLFEVGNGNASNARSNALEVYTNGAISTDNGTTKIRFGKDSSNNYGYIKEGESAVTPFGEGGGVIPHITQMPYTITCNNQRYQLVIGGYDIRNNKCYINAFYKLLIDVSGWSYHDAGLSGLPRPFGDIEPLLDLRYYKLESNIYKIQTFYTKAMIYKSSGGVQTLSFYTQGVPLKGTDNNIYCHVIGEYDISLS